MGNALAQIPTWLDDLAHGKRITEYEVFCVSSAIGLEDNPSKRELAKLWGSDPVHLTPEGYKKLAEKVLEKVASRKPKPLNPAKGKNAERRPGRPGRPLESGLTAVKEPTRPQKGNSKVKSGLHAN